MQAPCRAIRHRDTAEQMVEKNRTIKKTHFRLLSLNVCRPKSEMCSPEFVELIKESDCLFLQETKYANLDNDMIDEYFNKLGFVNYYAHRRDVSQRRSGGLATCIKKKWLNYIKIHDTQSKLALWFSLKKNVCDSDRDTIFGNIYLPPATSRYSNPDIFNELEDDLARLNTNPSYIVMAGDFNAHIGRHIEHPSHVHNLDVNE